MAKKTVLIKAEADADIDRALDYYDREAPASVDGLLRAFERTLASIGRSPGIGSVRYGYELEIPGLRHRLVRGFPYLVFYVEQDDTIMIVRVLHQSRDVPDELR